MILDSSFSLLTQKLLPPILFILLNLWRWKILPDNSRVKASWACMVPPPTSAISNSWQVHLTNSTHFFSLPFAPVFQENFSMCGSLEDDSLCRSSRINLKYFSYFQRGKFALSILLKKENVLPAYCSWLSFDYSEAQNEWKGLSSRSWAKHIDTDMKCTYLPTKWEGKVCYLVAKHSHMFHYIWWNFPLCKNCPVPGIISLAPRESLWGATLDCSPLTPSYPRARPFFKSRACMPGCEDQALLQELGLNAWLCYHHSPWNV